MMYYIRVTLKAKWQFKDLEHIKVTECKRVVNERTGKILNYNQRGYYINGKYYKKQELNKYLEKVKISEYPF